MVTSEQTSVNLQTPYNTYFHEEREQYVTIVGLRHIAQPGYYFRIQEITADEERSGGLIHFEYIESAPESEWLATSRVMQAKRALYESMWGAEASSLDGLGLVSQLDYLYPRPGWENHDIDDIELVRRLNAPALLLLSGLNAAFEHRLGCKDRQQLRDMAISRLKQEARENAGVQAESFNQRLLRLIYWPLDRVVIDARSEAALGAVDASVALEPERDLTLLWGENHVKGFDRGLINRGYLAVDKQRLTAIDFDALYEEALD